MADIEIEIDGKIISAKAGEMLIKVTDREGVSVPRFCYHKKLSVVASCRMCLIDVEGAPKPQPACSTPVNEGMKVHTQNDKAKVSQKAVMEFLLINHPLDCPICDQGGECELQDVAVEYGSDVSRFSEDKRIVSDSDIGALIQTDMTRCIHCTRCVRFGLEIAGIMEMGGTGRGEHLKIEPFLREGIQSELSGNMIDVCPVGALTSKPFRYELRSWQMHSIPSIARHDLVGSNLFVQTYKDKVKRVVSADNDWVNETWISDRDRFSYEGLTHENRLLEPQIKVQGQWKQVSWKVALDYAIKGLNSHVLKHKKVNQLGGLVSNTATMEELYLLKKILTEVGCDNIDHRLNVKNLDNTITLDSNIKLDALEKIDYALIVGANIRLEQPMINHRLRKATKKGADIDTLNVMAFDFNYSLNTENIIAPNKIAFTLAGVLKSVITSNTQELPDYLVAVEIDEVANKIASKLLNSSSSVIILGEHIINNEDASVIANLVTKIAKNTNSKTLNLSITANTIAANLVGFVPQNSGMNVNTMFTSDMLGFILLDIYPQYDFHDLDTAIKTFMPDNTFVISLNSFKDDIVTGYSDVIFPIASIYETSGTQLNINNDMKSYTAAVKAPNEVKPAWKVLKVMADLLELPGFHYADSTQIRAEISHQPHAKYVHDECINLTSKHNGISTIWQSSPYSIDAVLRHSRALQKTKIGQMNNACINPVSAEILGLSADDKYLGVPVVITSTVADDCVFINANQPTNIQEQE
ncbi:NADH dehydrogenase subunit G [Candidatus Ruthia magnifica str. Cm (Calyptogena magnifica)]|uniref:NADH-quinone oxidoreductase n=1 Tax=Ruthia magnifica subsp. Calyptogena magnifica TaxID=413404 RepID=A1AVR8_RUTMC|nr:NADH-quinone oxidoreductase subunit NuoG [Candidatus Ruthturnera calyptogenae]ABL02025.1 NADH dehydrogenase subunit G [Candidatus Ruthia magnifica str. Cm (Calyptogena magnifica)]